MSVPAKGQAKLDYLVGRSVEEVDVNQNGGWVITLTDQALITNLDTSLSPPVEVSGAVLVKATEQPPTLTFSQGTNPDGSAKIIEEISLTPDQYEVSMAGQEAAQPPPDDQLPPDPSPDRVVSGPEAP